MGLAAGILLGHALLSSNLTLGCISGLIALWGVAFTLSGLYAPRADSNPESSWAPSPRLTRSVLQDDLAPWLGELLIYEFRLISREDLDRALERQCKTGKRIGETLVEMGLISRSDLQRALRVQRACRDAWRQAG